jgi:hypothetical protein
MVRYALSVLQRLKPSRVIERKRAAARSAAVSAMLTHDGMSSGDCRNDVSGDVYKEMCAWVFVVRS